MTCPNWCSRAETQCSRVTISPWTMPEESDAPKKVVATSVATAHSAIEAPIADGRAVILTPPIVPSRYDIARLLHFGLSPGFMVTGRRRAPQWRSAPHLSSLLPPSLAPHRRSCRRLRTRSEETAVARPQQAIPDQHAQMPPIWPPQAERPWEQERNRSHDQGSSAPDYERAACPHAVGKTRHRGHYLPPAVAGRPLRGRAYIRLARTGSSTGVVATGPT